MFIYLTHKHAVGDPNVLHMYTAQGKGKVHPGTGHECSEGERRYSSTLSLTSALDGAGGQHHAPAALPPGNRLGTQRTEGYVGPRPV